MSVVMLDVKAVMAAGARAWRALLGCHSPRTLCPLLRPPTTSYPATTFPSLSRRCLSGEGDDKSGGDGPRATDPQGARGAQQGGDTATPVDARMEEARRRFGLGAAAKGSAPIAPVSKKVERKGEEGDPNIDWNEVWGDYVDYMTHQRDKGWKT